jgi:hypothetical protein
MVPLSSSSSKQRSERRIAVRLPLKVSGRDSRGMTFEEQTSSENLCRNGAAFVTRFDLPIGCDLEIRIPYSQSPARRNQIDRRNETDFATRGRVVHIAHLGNGESADASPAPSAEKIIGVQFTGPRFRRVFRSESAA